MHLRLSMQLAAFDTPVPVSPSVSPGGARSALATVAEAAAAAPMELLPAGACSGPEAPCTTDDACPWVYILDHQTSVRLKLLDIRRFL